MEEELRFGKYTEAEIEKILIGGLFPHEQEILEQGLKFFELSFQEYFFCKDHSIFDGEDSNINMLKVPSHTLIKRITDKLANTTREQIPWFEEFQKIALNVLYLNTKFLKQIGQEQLAIEGYQGILKNNEEFRKRLLKDFPEEKLGGSFLRMKEELDELKIAEGKLIWNGKPIVLKRLSEELANKNITEHLHEFSNVFEQQNICMIKKSKIDFFIILLYKLVFETDPKNELIVLKESGTNWGAIGVAENFFWYNSKSGKRRIYFRKRMANILKEPAKHKEIEIEVKNFLNDLF